MPDPWELTDEEAAEVAREAADDLRVADEKSSHLFRRQQILAPAEGKELDSLTLELAEYIRSLPDLAETD